MVLPAQDMLVFGTIAVNIALTLLLVFLHMKSYRSVSSKVTLGLLLFTAFFLVENILDLYFYSVVLSQALYGLTSFQLIVNFVQMIGLLILSYITLK